MHAYYVLQLRALLVTTENKSLLFLVTSSIESYNLQEHQTISVSYIVMFPEFKIVLQFEIHFCEHMNERIQENKFPNIHS